MNATAEADKMIVNNINLIPYDQKKLQIVREIPIAKISENENNNENLTAADAVTDQPQCDSR